MEKIKSISNHIKTNIFLYIIVLQPILDIIAYFQQNGVISPISFVARMAILAGSTLYILIKTKEKVKFILFLCGIAVFSLIHIIAAYLHGYMNIITDVTYLIKVLQMPILTVNIIQYMKIDSKVISKVEKGIDINVIIIAVSLVLAFITNTMQYTYSEGVGYTGWFFSANAQSIILVGIVPLFIYYLGKSKNTIIYIIGMIVGIGLLAINGTKTDFWAIFPILAICAYDGIYSKKIIKVIVPLILFLLIFIGKDYLPYYVRNEIKSNVMGTWNNELNSEKEKAKEKDKDKLQQESIYTDEILKRYPYNQIVEDFGYDAVKNKIHGNISAEKIMDNRYTKKIYAELIYDEHSTFSHFAGFEFTQISQYGMDLENDFTAIYYYYGYLGITLYLGFVGYFAIITIKYLIKNPKEILNPEIIFLGITAVLLLLSAEYSGAILRRPNASIYLSLVLALIYYKVKIAKLELEDKKLNDKKITILALHLGTGGVENAIVSLANMLCVRYEVEIISTYRITKQSFFELNDKVKVKYLIENMKPNKIEFEEAIKEKNIGKIIKQGIYSIKILYLKRKTMVQAIKQCDSGIVISTRILHNKWLSKYGNKNAIKIAEEHNHHNNNNRYIKQLGKSLENINYLITVSKELYEFYKEKYKNKKVIVKYIPNCLDKYPEKVSNLQGKSIITVGRLSLEKGYIELIDVFKLVNDRHPEWRLDIIGEGSERQTIEDEIVKQKLQNKVILHGTKNKKELEKLYLESSIYAMTSLTESFALVVLEAQSYGIPVVTFDTARGATELIENGKDGFIIQGRNKEEMAKKICYLIENGSIRNEMAQIGRKNAENYTQAEISERWYKFLDEIKNGGEIMKLFTVGPVEMYENTLNVRANQIPYFRTEEFSEIMLDISEKIKKCAGTTQDSKVAIITGSGTASMEAVVSNSFDKSDKVLIINGGSFGKRFKQLCEIYEIPNDEITLEFNEKLTQSSFENIDGSQYTALLVNIHETSVGQLYDINIIKEFCKKYNLYLVVDAISSFLSDDYKMDEWNIDCTIISSQKALALAPGLSIIIMNKKFYENKIEGKPAKNLYLNIEEHLKNMERGQTPFTPAVGVILELHERLNYIDKIGKNNVIKQTREIAEYFRNKIKDINEIELPNYNFSNTLTPIIVKGKATKIFKNLKEKYGIVLTPNGGDLKEDLLRVGHIGNVNKYDYDEVIKRIKEEL